MKKLFFYFFLNLYYLSFAQGFGLETNGNVKINNLASKLDNNFLISYSRLYIDKFGHVLCGSTGNSSQIESNNTYNNPIYFKNLPLVNYNEIKYNITLGNDGTMKLTSSAYNGVLNINDFGYEFDNDFSFPQNYCINNNINSLKPQDFYTLTADANGVVAMIRPYQDATNPNGPWCSRQVTQVNQWNCSQQVFTANVCIDYSGNLTYSDYEVNYYNTPCDYTIYKYFDAYTTGQINYCNATSQWNSEADIPCGQTYIKIAISNLDPCQYNVFGPYTKPPCP